MRFAAYMRTSTEDQQDPASSRAWQLARATQLIEPAGHVVAEFHDVGQSRSLPWRRRPEAARLLDLLAQRDRGFEAVVIAEPARAFAGAEFALVFPVFCHYGVDLWVPEVGGRVDPGSEAHDLVMMLFGGMSKGERNRIRVRVRSAMAQQATTGRFLGGRPPYGFMLEDAGAHPNPGKAADGVRIRRLVADPNTASVVLRIFEEYVGGRGIYAIAERLTADGIPSPSAHDAARNRHRQWSRGAWNKLTVRAILRNVRYTGHDAWGRQRREDVLVDVNDVALGHRQKMTWNDRDAWIVTETPTHDAIVSVELYERAQEIASSGARRTDVRKSPRTSFDYLLSGMIRCGVCGRSMCGQRTHGRPFYRCRVDTNYALTGKLDHPRNVFCREDKVVEGLDEWIVRVFDPDNLEPALAALANASAAAPGPLIEAEAARDKVADCARRIERLRAALESGDADPKLVGGWIADVQAERRTAEDAIRRAERRAPVLTVDEIAAALREIDVGERLAAADRGAKKRLYEELGVELGYDHTTREVTAQASPPRCLTVCVGGGI